MSCAPAKVNQYIKVDKVQIRDGKWKENVSTEHGDLVSIGKYRKGNKVGVWRSTLENNIYQKERYRKTFIKTKFYHPNGKIKIKGQSTTEITDDYIHWFYTGDWKHYDENGKMIYIKKYIKRKPSDSISVQRNTLR